MSSTHGRLVVTRSRPRLALAAVTCAAMLVGLGAASATNAGAATARVVIGAGAPVGSGAHVVAVPSDVAFAVVLHPGHASELSALAASVANPTSPLYRHFLAKGQFATRFAAPLAARSRVVSFFRSYGLRVTASVDNSLMLNVSGRSSQVARAFAARLVSVRAYGTVATQFLGAATLPRDVSSDLSGVAGLSTWRRPHAMARVTHAITHSSPHSVTLPGSCSGANAQANSSPGEFTIAQQAKAYGIDHQWSNGINAAGQTIAVYELTNYNSSDISTYFGCYSLSPSLTNVGVDGGPGPFDTSDSSKVEAALDIEEAGALAPGAHLLVYKGPNDQQGPIDVYGVIAQADQASVVTTSWGMCESASGQASAIASEAVFFQQMALQGQSVMAAAGDDGSSDCAQATGDYTVNVDDPASQPDVTGVGGLTVNSIASTSPPSTLSQSVWNDGGGAGGGGVSQIWDQPKWQTGGNVPNLGHRLVPDLSVMADPATGFITYALGGWTTVGGTSIGSPIMAAVVATANQLCGGRVGMINPTIYSMSAKGNGFNDVTSGNNALYFEAGGHYAAGSGYDMASGLGSPDPATFIPDLCSSLPAIATSTIAVSPTSSVALSSSAHVTVTVRNSDNVGISFLTPSVTATEPGASPSVTPVSAQTNGSGQATFLVSTTVPGTVTVSATFGTLALGSAQTSFVASSSVTSRPLAALPVPAVNQRSAATTPSEPVVVGVSLSGHIFASSGPSRITDFTGLYRLPAATGAPALDCSGASCLALADVRGHLVAIYNVNAPSTSQVVDYGARYVAAASVTSNSLALADHRGVGYFDATFLNANKHLMLAHYVTSTRSMSFTDLTTKDRLHPSSGATSIVDASGVQRYIATTVGSTYWLVSDGVASGAQSVAVSTHYGAAGASALTTAPTLVRNTSTGQLDLLGRTPGGAVIVFVANANTPTRLTHFFTVAASGASTEAFLANPKDPNALSGVLFTQVGHLRLSESPAWGSFDITAPAPVAGPQVIAGPRPLVLAGGAYFSVSP